MNLTLMFILNMKVLITKLSGKWMEYFNLDYIKNIYKSHKVNFYKFFINKN